MDRIECLDEQAVQALGDGTLPAEEQLAMWAHLAECGACSARLDSVGDAEAADTPTCSLAGDESDRVIAHASGGSIRRLARGAILDRYIIVRELGSGGLGLVYLAYDPELDRRVAIKVLRPSALDGDDSDLHQVRLIREAKAMARFSHPNIVSVHDVGVFEGQVFISMEFVDGLGLRQWVSQNDPSQDEIRDVMLEAAQGLEEAHRSGLVHRDFKPSNVLVTADRRVKVLDFGLARSILTMDDLEGGREPASGEVWSRATRVEESILSGRSFTSKERLTVSGQLLGTPGYMPPEQYGANPLVDARGDQFSFCVTLFEMLYRRRPFRGSTLEQVREATCSGVIGPRREGVLLAPEIERTISRGLSVEPEGRFSDMGELRRALQPPGALGSPKRAVLAAFAGFSLCALLAIGVGLLVADEPVPEEIQHIDHLVGVARNAAAESFYVYPPASDPNTPTAYTSVLELERVEGAGAELAQLEAAELRASFAATLVRLGDRYWEHEAARSFAVDYYAAALLFEPEHPRASRRVQLSPGQLSEFKRRAVDRDFSRSELRVAASLLALAESDDSKRSELVAALYDGGQPPLVAAANLEVVFGSKVMQEAIALADTSTEPSKVPGRPAPSADMAASPTSSPGTRVSHADRPARRLDGGANEAQDIARKGLLAMRASRLDRASALFHQALDLDSKNLRALSGLAELEFERGHYGEVLRFGRRAARRAPGNAEVRVLLGDAYFKLVNYPLARREYEKARELGHPDAAERLEQLAARKK